MAFLPMPASSLVRKPLSTGSPAPLAHPGATLLAVLTALAGWHPASADPVRLTVAVPESADSVSLGVYDSESKLVRQLATAEPLTSFPTHLNGIGVEWDGTGSDGKPLPAGTYSVSGFSLPDTLSVEGEAVHFNTLVSADGQPVARSVSAIVELDPPRFVAPSSEGETIWTLAADGLPAEPLQLGGSRRFVDFAGDRFLLHDGTRWHLQPRDPIQAPVNVEAPMGAAALGKDAWALAPSGQNKLSIRSAWDGSFVRDVPIPTTPSFIAAVGEGFLFSDGKSLWSENNSHIAAVPTPGLVEIFSVAAGPESTFWLAGRTLPDEGGLPVVRQYSSTGDILRQIMLPAGTRTALVRGDVGALRVGILHEDPSRLAFMGLSAPPGTPSTPEPGAVDSTREVEWEILFEHHIEHAGEPGLRDGRPVARDASPSLPVRFSLPAHDLGPASKLILEVRNIKGGFWLVASGGLTLLEVAPAHPDSRPSWQKIDENRLAVLIPMDGAAAEFTVSGIRGIVPIDGGTVEWQP